MVRRALRRHLTADSEPTRVISASPSRSRPILDEAAIAALQEGSTFSVPPGTLVTPLARDAARTRRIRLEEGASRAPATLSLPQFQGKRRVAVGADHGGVAMKTLLVKHLQEEGYEIVDVGPSDDKPVDYPDYAYAVARLVSEGQAEAGIMIDGVGIGSCMVANKVPGVRASMCYDVSTARNAREHNHANYLTLGGQLIGPLLAKQITSAWLSTPFGAGRHADRVSKIMDVEQRYLKKS
ncbi:MAG: ribose 5-phosphate isomerase B [Ardenticatenales bacterium]|nr:ribose 5-phosphate isomerase B [Ardenticatenales bacterium]